MRQKLYRALALAFFIFAPVLGQAQTPQQNAERTMASIIVGFQVGGMNWNRFYPNVYQVVYQQTGGSGVYVQLRSLGALQNVVLTGGWALPAGFFYTFRSFFPGGAVDWQVAVDASGNVAFIAFGPANQIPIPNSTQPPNPNPPQPSSPPTPAKIDKGGAKPVSPTSESDACSMFPQMCPASGN